MIRTTIAIAGAVALISSAARASEPVDVQDPPGRVDVHQPADVALEERNTERDATDTLRGERTEVIDASAAEAATAEVEWRNIEPGEEARASFDEPAPADDAGAASTDSMPGTVYSDDSWLGTDLGYGVGTEPAEAAER